MVASPSAVGDGGRPAAERGRPEAEAGDLDGATAEAGTRELAGHVTRRHARAIGRRAKPAVAPRSFGVSAM